MPDVQSIKKQLHMQQWTAIMSDGTLWEGLTAL